MGLLLPTLIFLGMQETVILMLNAENEKLRCVKAISQTKNVHCA